MYAKPTQNRLIDQRARRRAMQDLIEHHKEEYKSLYDWHRQNAASEAELLAQKSDSGHDHPPRLMRGRRKPGQEAVDRLDVARCPECIDYHDSGHRCERCGSLPAAPHATMDEIAIQRAMSGQHVRLSTPERTEVLRRLIEQGKSAAQIADLMHVTSRSVKRWKAELEMVSQWKLEQA